MGLKKRGGYKYRTVRESYYSWLIYLKTPLTSVIENFFPFTENNEEIAII